MNPTKKRKAVENEGVYPVTADFNNAVDVIQPPSLGILSPEDADKILEPFTKEQLLPILQAAVLRHPDVLEAVRAVADADIFRRKLFVRGLSWETATEKLRQVFSQYGELDQNTIVITDKNTGKSKGYGFVTYKHIDAAILALKEPNKMIDGRMTVTKLAAAGSSGNARSSDVAMRKIYVGNIPREMSSDWLLDLFSMYGEIEEGPLRFDKQIGKAMGFASFVYKTEEGAKASLINPMKIINGQQMFCMLATDDKKEKPNVGPPGGMVPGMPNAGPMGMGARNYGMGGGYMGYGPGPNMRQPSQQRGMMHPNTGFNSNMSGQGGQGNGGGPGGYGSGAPLYDGAGPGESGGGDRMPPGGMGLPSSGDYPDIGNYGFQSGYPQQSHPSGPESGLPAYQGMPPY